MKPMFFRAWLIGTVFGSASFGMINAASAQSVAGATPSTQGLSTINVVARKKVENLQKVPLSVTAITAKTLKQAHVENLHEIIALTPGVNVADFGAEAGTTITIRGDTDQTFGINVPDVATFVDGAYIREPDAINIAAVPLSDVEVIKGPVSALYGRDAFAGVIEYNIARPSDTPHADISETAGDYGKSELQGDISGPIFGDKVLGELFGDFDTFNGTYHDNVSGADAGGDTKKDFGGLLDFNWTPNITTHLDFYYGYDYFNNAAVEALKPNCGAGAEINPDGSPNFAAPNLYCGTVKSNGSVQVGNNPAAGNAGNERRTFYGSMDNAFNYSWGTIDSVTGASQVDEQAFQPFDASSLGEPYQIASIANPTVADGYEDEHAYYGSANRTGNVSEELRYTSPQNQAFRYGAGTFFYTEERYYSAAASVTDGNLPAGQEFLTENYADPANFATPTGSVGPNINAAKLSTDEEAGFANAELDLLPNLTIASQYRYSWVLEKNTVTSYEYGDDPGVTTGAEPHLAEQYFATNESVRWFPLPNQMLYFAFANGEKPGGFNNTYAAEYASFSPETDTSYEGGFKSEIIPGRFQLDGTAYHIDSTNIQEYVPLSDGSEAISNANGKTSNTGFELDVRAEPVDGLTITGGFNYNNPTFDAGAFDAGDAYNCLEIASCHATEIAAPPVGLLEEPIKGHTVPLTSKETFDATAEYDSLLMDQYPVYVRGDYSYQSSQFTDATNLTSIPASGILDLFAGISKGRYTLSAYVKNVTNDQAPNFFQYDSTLDYYNHVPTVSLAPGRTFAFTVAAKF